MRSVNLDKHGRANKTTKVGHRRKPRNVYGYTRVYMPDHPRALKDGYVLEHIPIMESIIGRPLAPGENVHHRNRKRSDNEPHNLELWTTGQPEGGRVTDLVLDMVRDEMLGIINDDRVDEIIRKVRSRIELGV